MGTRVLQRSILVFVCTIACAASAAAQAGAYALIKGVNLVDPETGKVEENVDISIQGGFIKAVGKNLQRATGQHQIDKTGKFVVPGLVDTRVQISASPGNQITRAEFGVEQRLAWMQSMVGLGVTTARFIQGDIKEHVSFRHFRELSLLNGPWILASGPTFTAVGGNPANQYSIVATPVRERETHEVGDMDHAVQQSRDVAHNGGDVFEVNLSAGPSWIAAPVLKDDLLALVTKEAHGHDLRVFCWVGTNAEAASAIRNGCDVLQGLTEEAVSDDVLKLMAERKIPFVPSLVDQGYLMTNKTSPQAFQAYIADDVVQRALSPLMKKSLRWDPNSAVAQMAATLPRLVPLKEEEPKFTVENKDGVISVKPKEEPKEPPSNPPTPKQDSTSPAKPDASAPKPQSDENTKRPTVGEALRAQEERARQNVGRMTAAGIPMVVGTGAGDLLDFPGASAHLELQLLVEAGLTPLQALQAATRNAVQALGGKDYGAVARGQRADFLVLNANPLQNVKNLSQIDIVVRGGFFVNPADPTDY